jgi:hypothetical protein
MKKITMDGSYKTRNGRAVEILRTNINTEHYKVAALVTDSDGKEVVETYRADGCYMNNGELSNWDLVEAPTVVYVNLHRNGNAYWYGTKAEAQVKAGVHNIAIAVPVEVSL